MFRHDMIPFTHPDQLPRWPGTCSRFLPPLSFWLCATVILRLGFYGDHHLMLGPSSSRMMKASAVFAEQVKVRDENGTRILVYGFTEEPELNKEANWSSSSYLTVGSYDRKGYALWSNKGSKICMRWATQTSRSDKIEILLIKGFFIIIMLLLVKSQESCDTEFDWGTPTFPILPKKPASHTNESSAEEDNDDGTGSSRNSSVDLNDAKLCIICYDDERNCCFIPCGHSATCFECAKRVMEEDNKMCPICRKLIRKAKRLFTP